MLYMFLANGFEETEAIGCLDVIKRAGIDIKTVSIESGQAVTGSHGITVNADIMKADIKKEECRGVILPGGMPGTLNLEKDEAVKECITYCNEKNMVVAAICAAPMIFGKMGLLKGRKATCYPGFEEHFNGGEYTGELVSVCENVITGKGAGAAMLFGAEIVNYFEKGKGHELLKEMQHPVK